MDDQIDLNDADAPQRLNQQAWLIKCRAIAATYSRNPDKFSRKVFLKDLHTFPAAALTEDGRTCPICMDDMEPEMRAVFGCPNHVFHKACLLNWLQTTDEKDNFRRACPTCRTCLHRETGVDDDEDEENDEENEVDYYENEYYYDEIEEAGPSDFDIPPGDMPEDDWPGTWADQWADERDDEAEEPGYQSDEEMQDAEDEEAAPEAAHFTMLARLYNVLMMPTHPMNVPPELDSTNLVGADALIDWLFMNARFRHTDGPTLLQRLQSGCRDGYVSWQQLYLETQQVKATLQTRSTNTASDELSHLNTAYEKLNFQSRAARVALYLMQALPGQTAPYFWVWDWLVAEHPGSVHMSASLLDLWHGLESYIAAYNNRDFPLALDLHFGVCQAFEYLVHLNVELACDEARNGRFWDLNDRALPQVFRCERRVRVSPWHGSRSSLLLARKYWGAEDEGEDEF